MKENENQKWQNGKNMIFPLNTITLLKYGQGFDYFQNLTYPVLF